MKTIKKPMKILQQKKSESLCIANFESIVENAITIHYSEDSIEIPGVLILKREGSGTFLDSFLNPAVEVIEIESGTFDNMINTIKTAEVDDKIIFDTEIKPSRTVVLNLAKLAENAVFVRKTASAIFVDNFVFTNSKVEFHGEGMFTMRKVYYIDDLQKIENLFECE